MGGGGELVCASELPCSQLWTLARPTTDKGQMHAGSQPEWLMGPGTTSLISPKHLSTPAQPVHARQYLAKGTGEKGHL